MKFSELVNIDELRGLCESYTANTGAATALLELDGTILIATGWQDICTRFHRVNDATACRCRESDTILAGELGKGEPYNIYKVQKRPGRCCCADHDSQPTCSQLFYRTVF